MCFRYKHFPAQHNDRTSLTLAVISEFKLHEMRQRPGPHIGELTELPRPHSWIRGGEGDKEGGELEKEGGGGKGRRGGEGRRRGRREEGKGKGRDPTKFWEKLKPLFLWPNILL